jgi:hypothetical protein
MRCWESPGDLPLVIEIVVSFRSFRSAPLAKRHNISITRGRSPGLSQERMQEPIILSLSCVCVCVKPSFSSLFPISILIQLFRCLEVVKTFSLSMIMRTRPRLWRQSELACQFARPA